LLRTNDLRRGLLVSRNWFFSSGWLVGMLYSLTADRTNVEASGTDVIFIRFADTARTENLDRYCTSESSACTVLDASNISETGYPQPVAFMPRGNVVSGTGDRQPRLGLPR
jgi:hypothetical protein